MKLIVGLGNPGSRYRATRHNVGRRVVERLAARRGLELDETRFEGRFGQAGDIALLQPETFMNRSGRSVAEAVQGLPLADPAADLLLVFDDVDLPFGQLRLRPGGGAGGHRGLADVLAVLERRDLPRLRFGVGRPPAPANTVDHVLAAFSDSEEQALDAHLERAAEAVEQFVALGLSQAMNRVNRVAEVYPGNYSATTTRPKKPAMGAMPTTPEHSSIASVPRQPLAQRIVRPFVRFAELEVSSALLLVAMTVAALVWANSPWGASYEHFWHTHAGFTFGDSFALDLSLGHWVNDALMAIFFFVVGMEIKRELVQGELSSRARAMLPVMGALGGMVVPAGIYALFHLGEPTIRGWGIPMATDIAFAVAALSLLGKRVPSGLRIFLLALAIADDLGAVAVIAIFYTAEIHLSALGLAGLGLAGCVLLRVAGVRSLVVYGVVGLFVWYQTHHSGVHATVAGVLLGFLTPTSPPAADHDTLVDRGRQALEHLRDILRRHNDPQSSHSDHGGHQRHHLARQLSEVGREALSPVDLLTNALERWVAFAIMPVFALANAGVVLEASTLAEPSAQRVAVAVCLGLLIGKPVGITLFSWLAVRSGIAALPRGVNWWAILATGVLAGIGFTVALFVTALAFDSAVSVAGAKVGILVGSLVATVLGLAVLARALPPAPAADSKPTA